MCGLDQLAYKVVKAHERFGDYDVQSGLQRVNQRRRMGGRQEMSYVQYLYLLYARNGDAAVEQPPAVPGSFTKPAVPTA